MPEDFGIRCRIDWNTHNDDICGERISKNVFLKRVDYSQCWDSSLSFSSNGDITPCYWAKNMLIANIKDKSIRELVRDKDVVKYWYNSVNDFPICKDCEFKYACFHCPILSNSIDKNSNNGKNILCTYDPYSGKWTN